MSSLAAPERRDATGDDSAAAELWYKDAIIYELNVRSFFDSTGSGMGDFGGLSKKLDYIQELGVTALWLLPFCPSLWRDDGYDVSDYLDIHPAYGCLDDFKIFLEECKRRSLRLITELVLNHTSDAHAWFQRARHAPPGSRWRDFYVWSDTPDRYSGVRIIFSDFEKSNWTWDPVAKAYYWHRFYSHQPDLNFDSPDVRQAVFDTVDFWFDMGVDGLRLDAVPYLYEREGTNCENLPETHAFLRDLRAHVDSRYSDRMLLAEANQWPEDAAAYFGSGDECHMAFHFPLMPRLFMATRMEDSFPIINIIEQTPIIPRTCQWATFLRNHDELTLEMVCDEDRDYMYKVYGHDPEMRLNVGIRRRLAPLMDNDRRRMELLNALILSLPGTPVIYYGDEIGMGEDLRLGDRNGVRTPMQWNSGKNAGFSEAEPERLFLPVITGGEYDYALVNVEAQQHKQHSLLWWMRRAIAARRQSAALTRGSIQFLYPSNRHVLVFLRRTETEEVLVVANLSRFAQSVRLRIGSYAGRTPVELFGQVEFAPVEDDDYGVTLAPYGYYWLALRPVQDDIGEGAAAPVSVEVTSFPAVLEPDQRATLNEILLPYLRSASRLQARMVTHAEVVDLIPFNAHSAGVIVEVQFGGGEPEVQLVPLTIIDQKPGHKPGDETHPIALLHTSDGRRAVLAGGIHNGGVSSTLLDLIAKTEAIETESGRISGHSVGPFAHGVLSESVCLVPYATTDIQRNLSVSLGDLYVLKVLRRLEPGANPELGIVRFLFEQAGFTHVAPVAGYLEYQPNEGEPVIAGILNAYVNSRGDFWRYTMDQLGLFIDRAAAHHSPPAALAVRHPIDVQPEHIQIAADLVQTYLPDVRLLGQRLATMHLALASDTTDPDFAPEPSSAFYVRGRYHSMAGMTRSVMTCLGELLPRFTEETQADASAALSLESRILEIFRDGVDAELAGLRIRVHGDCHLGQILHTGDDIIFIDFEGDNTLPLRERLLKRSPLVDLGGILFSLRYAAACAHVGYGNELLHWRPQASTLAAWIQLWFLTVSGACLRAYRKTLADSPLVPAEDAEFRRLLDVMLVAKAVYQVGYELANRPGRVQLAVRLLREVVASTGGGSRQPER